MRFQWPISAHVETAIYLLLCFAIPSMARLYSNMLKGMMQQSRIAEGLMHSLGYPSTQNLYTLFHIQGFVYFNVQCRFAVLFSNSLDFAKQLQSHKTSKEESHPHCTCTFDPRQVQHSRQEGMGADFQVLPSVVSATFSYSFLISVIAPVTTISSQVSYSYIFICAFQINLS